MVSLGRGRQPPAGRGCSGSARGSSGCHGLCATPGAAAAGQGDSGLLHISRWGTNLLGPPGSATGTQHRREAPVGPAAPGSRGSGARRRGRRRRPYPSPPSSGPLPSAEPPAGLEATRGGGRGRRQRSCKSHDFPAYINHSLFFSTGCRLKGAVSAFSPKGRGPPGCF